MDLFSDLSDVDLAADLITDLQQDLVGRVGRLRYLTDLSSNLGTEGTMIFGGTVAFSTYGEARSSFVNGNFVATIVLCQALAEHLLADFLHTAALHIVPHKVHFKDTLARCAAIGILTESEVAELDRLSKMRNPLTHFRPLDDHSNVDRRAIDSREHPVALLDGDAHVAIGIVIRLLSKRPFKLG